MDHQFQLEIEKLFNSNQLIPRIIREFKDSNFGEYMDMRGIPQKFGFDLLAQMVLHKRATLPTLVGLLRKHFIKTSNPSQSCTDMLHKAAEADLMNWDGKTDKFILIWDVTSQVQEDLDRYQYPMPMVIEPLEVQTNKDTGYLTIKNSIMLQDNHTEDDLCLDHINTVNRIRLVVNNDTARMVKNKWRNLDKPKHGESLTEFNKRRRQFEKYDRTAKDVMEHLTIAEDGFCVTHKYDFRGRTYAQGYHVNPQGTPWNKAVIEFAHKEVAA